MRAATLQQLCKSCRTCLKPNTHRRRRRDETVLSNVASRRVGGVYMNSRRLPTDSAMRTHIAAVGRYPVHDCRRACVHTDDTTKLSPTSCEFVYTPPTRRDSTVSSRRRRRCVLGIKFYCTFYYMFYFTCAALLYRDCIQLSF